MRRGFWNGERCGYQIGTVICGRSESSFSWCRNLFGERIPVVKVFYGDEPFYLYNGEDQEGVVKVTIGRGSPQYPHSSVPAVEGTFETDDTDELAYQPKKAKPPAKGREMRLLGKERRKERRIKRRKQAKASKRRQRKR